MFLSFYCLCFVFWCDLLSFQSMVCLCNYVRFVCVITCSVRFVFSSFVSFLVVPLLVSMFSSLNLSIFVIVLCVFFSLVSGYVLSCSVLFVFLFFAELDRSKLDRTKLHRNRSETNKIEPNGTESHRVEPNRMGPNQTKPSWIKLNRDVFLLFPFFNLFKTKQTKSN